MKKTALLALIGALMVALVAGAAVAKPGSGNSGSGSDNSGKKKVTYVFHGAVTALTQAVTDPNTGLPIPDPNTGLPVEDSVTVDVKQGNKAARTFVAANGNPQTFKVDANTEVNESEDATLADVVVGDRVKVQVKAPPSATALTARQLQVKNEDDS